MSDITILKNESMLDYFFEEMVNFCDKIIAVDVETDGTLRSSVIYGIGIAVNPKRAFYVPIRDRHGEYFFDLSTLEILKSNLIELLQNSKLIGHNLVFDVIKLKQFLNADFCEYIHGDTILMRHLLYEDGPFGLKEMAAIEFGRHVVKAQEELFENVKKNGGKITASNCEYHKADTEILGTYCAWDVMLTYRLYEKYLPMLKKEKLDVLYNEEVLPLYKYVTIPMNERGLKVDLDVLKNLQAEITKDINKLEDDIISEIKDLIVEYEDQLVEESAPVKNKGLFIQKYAERVGFCMDSFSKKTLNTLIPSNTEQEDFLRFARGEVDKTPLTKEIQRLVFFDKYPDQRYIFNLRSKHHLKWLFFDKLKLTPLTTTDKGNPQVNEDFLSHLVENKKVSGTWVKTLLDLNKLEKLRGTYIDGILERLEDGCVYPSFLQFGTTSGRYASRNPNVQNLPRPKEEDSNESEVVLKYNNSIRKIFVSRPGYVFVDADYSSLEPRCFAYCSGDVGLQHVFKNGEDLYSSLAINVFNINDASSFKSDANFLGKKYPEARQKMKVVSLAAVYGASEYRLAKLLKITPEEAKVILDDYMCAYPGLKNYIESCHESVKKYGYVKTVFGRKRHLTKAKELLDFNEKLMDYTYAKKNNLLDEYWELRNYLNNSTNFPIQGLAAHIVNRAMINLTKELKKNNMDGIIVLQVHDQIVCEVKEEQADKCVELVKKCMENVIDFVPLVAEPKIAKNLKDSH